MFFWKAALTYGNVCEEQGSQICFCVTEMNFRSSKTRLT